MDVSDRLTTLGVSSVIAERFKPTRNGVWPVAIVLAMAIFAWLWWPQLYPLDDPYITLHNARVFLSGQPDHAYETSYLTGATSPVHLLLVAFGSLFIEPLWAPLVIGLAGAGFYLLALLKLAKRLNLSTVRTAAVVAIGLLGGNNVFQYLNGLETSLAMAAAAWMLLWCDDRQRLPWLGALAPFIRPELGLLAALLLVRLALQSNLKQTIRMGLITALVAIPWAAWVFHETGHVFPNTIGAKLAFFHPAAVPILIRVLLVLYYLALSLNLIFFVGLPGLLNLPAGRSAAAFVAIGVATSAAIEPTIFDWNFGRYAAVYVPLLALGIVFMAADKSRIVTILIGMLLSCTAFTAIRSTQNYVKEIEYARGVQDHARFVANLPKQSVVLIHDAGQVAWENPKARLVDIVGLKNPEIVSVHRELTHKACRRARALDFIGREYSATHLVVINRWSWPCIVSNMREAGWKLRPIYNHLYTVFEIIPPTGRGRTPPKSVQHESD